MRLDLFLTVSGLTKSRTEAARLIGEGAVTVSGQVQTKPSFQVAEDTPADRITVDRDRHPFVSRGGEKLEAAIRAFGLSPLGCDALDVGASSGGFTDCLLRHGAARVYAVDAGVGQLVPSLRDDPRVLSLERYNARFLRREDFPTVPTFAVMDVSFISSTLILPALSALLPRGAAYIGLIKPQFEVGREGIGKGGIVKDAALRRRAVETVVACAEGLALRHLGTIDSPILGGDGNREFLSAFVKE